MLDPSLIKTKTLERAAKEVSKAKVKCTPPKACYHGYEAVNIDLLGALV